MTARFRRDAAEIRLTDVTPAKTAGPNRAKRVLARASGSTMHRHTHRAAAKNARRAMNVKTTQVTKNADIKATIDAMNPNCPRYQAHATLHYNMGSDEKQARAKFTELREQLQSQGQGPLDLKCAGPPEYWGDHAPYDMRAIGLTHHRTQELDALHAQAAAVFGLDYEEPTPHTSLVYDWIGSPAVNQKVVDEIRAKWPALGGSVRFDGLALVDMRDADVGEWKILDRMEFEEHEIEDDLETVATA